MRWMGLENWLGLWFQTFLLLPSTWGNFEYFSDGLVQPPTRLTLLICKAVLSFYGRWNSAIVMSWIPGTPLQSVGPYCVANGVKTSVNGLCEWITGVITPYKWSYIFYLGAHLVLGMKLFDQMIIMVLRHIAVPMMSVAIGSRLCTTPNQTTWKSGRNIS